MLRKNPRIYLETHLSQNKAIKLSLTEKIWNNFYFIKVMVSQSGFDLEQVPEKHRSILLYQLAVAQDAAFLELVPCELYKEEFYRLALQHKGCRLPLDNLPLPELNNGILLYNVPEEQRTPELCKQAVEQSGDALVGVPFELRTLELCELAVKNDSYALEDVPSAHITLELCKLAVQKSGNVLGYVPERFRTAELCQLAVEQSGDSLEYVPEKVRTPELCQLAVKNTGLALKYVPDTVINESFFNEIITHYENLYFKKSIGHQLFSTYDQSHFFSKGVALASKSKESEYSLLSFKFRE